MTNQPKSNLQMSLQTLGLIGLIFFVMAFACQDQDNEDRANPNGGRTPQTENNGGRKCSTEEQFKNLLIENFSNIYNERDGKFKETEVEFQTFNIGRPFRFQKSYPEIIDAKNAYPVKTSFITRDYLNEKSFPRMREKQANGFNYVFYIDHHGDCVFAYEGGGTSDAKSIPIER